jgi:hypothetical protein
VLLRVQRVQFPEMRERSRLLGLGEQLLRRSSRKVRSAVVAAPELDPDEGDCAFERSPRSMSVRGCSTKGLLVHRKSQALRAATGASSRIAIVESAWILAARWPMQRDRVQCSSKSMLLWPTE